MNHFREINVPNCFAIKLSHGELGLSFDLCLIQPPGLFLLPLVFVVFVILFPPLSFVHRRHERERGRTANLTSRGLTHRPNVPLLRGHQSARRRICDEGKNERRRPRPSVVGSIHQISRRKIAAGKQIMVLRQIKGGRSSVHGFWRCGDDVGSYFMIYRGKMASSEATICSSFLSVFGNNSSLALRPHLSALHSRVICGLDDDCDDDGGRMVVRVFHESRYAL